MQSEVVDPFNNEKILMITAKAIGKLAYHMDQEDKSMDYKKLAHDVIDSEYKYFEQLSYPDNLNVEMA